MIDDYGLPCEPDSDPCEHHDHHRVVHHVAAHGSDGLALLVGWLLWREWKRSKGRTAPSVPIPQPRPLGSVLAWCAVPILIAAAIGGSH
jgi:hypothetical protein